MSGTKHNIDGAVLALAFMTAALSFGQHLFLDEKTVPLKGS